MASSKVSPIFNTFAGAAEFYTQEKCGTLMLKATQYSELLSAVLAELTILYNGTQNKSETPSKVFGHHARFRQLIDDDKVLWKLTKEQMEGIEGEQAVFDLFSDYYKYEMLMA
jgi:hypothetical protein